MKHVTIKVNIQINEQIVLSCLQCEYKCRFNIQLKKHMNRKHCGKETEQGKYKCVLCSFNGNFLHDIWKHRQAVHADAIPEYLPQTKSSQDMARQDEMCAFLKWKKWLIVQSKQQELVLCLIRMLDGLKTTFLMLLLKSLIIKLMTAL